MYSSRDIDVGFLYTAALPISLLLTASFRLIYLGSRCLFADADIKLNYHFKGKGANITFLSDYPSKRKEASITSLIVPLKAGGKRLSLFKLILPYQARERLLLFKLIFCR
jgi:hypothetical protein